MMQFPPYMNSAPGYSVPPYMNAMPPMMGPKSMPSGAPPLYIGNLDETVYEEQLFSHFSKYGPIHSLRIVKDSATNRSRGFGYINFMQAKDAENARLLSQYEKIGRNPIRLMYKRNIQEIHDSNVFVRNIDPSVSFKDLHNLFMKVGKVLAVRIAMNGDKSLGYGYVQMEKKEDAAKAIETLNGFKLKEKEITTMKFVPKGQRNIHASNNLYAKNFPQDKSQQEIENLLKTKFGEYGPIVSLAVKFCEKQQKHCAFVCFEKTDDAQKAIDSLANKDVFGTGEPLYINWHQSRFVRDSELKRSHLTTKNENNLYIKNLKVTVTEQDVRNAFSVFGEIISVAVKKHEVKPEDQRASGFVAFKVPADARKAQSEGNANKEIRELFIEGCEPYITFWQPKQQRDQFNASKYRNALSRRGPHFGNDFMGGGYPMPYMNMPGGFPFIPPFQRPGRFYPQRGHAGGPRGRQMGGPRTGGQFGGPTAHNGPRTGGQRGGPRQYGAQQQPKQGRPYGQQQERVSSQHQNREQQPKERAQAQPLDTQANITVQSLKEKLDDFLKLDAEKQRNILGELLYPKIVARTNPSHAPKITGMLVDFDVLTVQDILEMLDDEQILDERIQEAMELINQEN